jgi:hypothetical protein
MWREVDGYPGYVVSRSGKVRGRYGKILRGRTHKNGRRYVWLYRKGLPRKYLQVGQLVALAFDAGRPNTS